MSIHFSPTRVMQKYLVQCHPDNYIMIMLVMQHHTRYRAMASEGFTCEDLGTGDIAFLRPQLQHLYTIQRRDLRHCYYPKTSIRLSYSIPAEETYFLTRQQKIANYVR